MASVQERLKRRRAWGLAGFLFVLLLTPRAGSAGGAIGFLLAAVVVGAVFAAATQILAIVLQRWLGRTYAALPFKNMSGLASALFAMFVLLSVWFRFNPLIYLIASILGANGVRMIMLSTAVELLVAFIPIVMILFGDLLPGTKNQLPQAEQ